MRLFLPVVLALALVAGQAPASTLNWVTSKGGGNGSVIDLTNASPYDAAFILIGSDCTKVKGPVDTKVQAIATDPVPYAGVLKVSGLFSYLSLDKRGATFDPFGYLVNGVKAQLTGDAGAQAGKFSFLLNPGDSFGWYLTAADKKGGAGIASVVANIAPVPLPGGALLLIGAIGLLGATRRRDLSA